MRTFASQSNRSTWLQKMLFCSEHLQALQQNYWATLSKCQYHFISRCLSSETVSILGDSDRLCQIWSQHECCNIILELECGWNNSGWMIQSTDGHVIIYQIYTRIYISSTGNLYPSGGYLINLGTEKFLTLIHFVLFHLQVKKTEQIGLANK